MNNYVINWKKYSSRVIGHFLKLARPLKPLLDQISDTHGIYIYVESNNNWADLWNVFRFRLIVFANSFVLLWRIVLFHSFDDNYKNCDKMYVLVLVTLQIFWWHFDCTCWIILILLIVSNVNVGFPICSICNRKYFA